MKRAAVSAVVAAGVVLTACGGGGDTSSMRPDAAAQLQSDVLSLTQQAAAHNWTAARTALSTLKADLAASVSAGAISNERAAQLQATIAQVSGELPAAVTPAPTPTATKTTPKKAPAPAPPAKHGHGHGDGGGGDG